MPVSPRATRRNAVFCLLTMPFKIFFGVLLAVLLLPFAVLLIPFLLLRFVIKAAVLVLVMPFVLVVVLVAAGLALTGAFLALLVPLLPLAFVAFCVWAIVRMASGPAYAR